MGAQTLTPFNPTAICPKCGGDQISAGYQAERSHCYTCYQRTHTEGLCCIEHIDRWCTRCRFSWAEAPLDVRAAAASREGAG